MFLRALHTSGMLDISSQESLQVYNESEPFRLALRPGQVVEVEDHWRKLKNIDSAIRCGLLEVLAYNYSHVGEEVTHAELNQTLEGYLRRDDLISAYPQEIPDGINRTFTVPIEHSYESNTIALILNGQTLPKNDILENVGNKSVTLHPDVSTPKSGDIIILTYMKI